ncbi:hypothetical protein [Thalassobellus citreus]|uniref:hypothetical protein n=1 Tax=Thalassobellus citreus TaxID=3367752 RepID=UPI0037B06505
MITEEQKEGIIEVLGYRYCKTISEALNKKGIRNKYGLPHTSNMIAKVMSGQEHKEIEPVIFQVVEAKKQELKEQEARRNRILSA